MSIPSDYPNLNPKTIAEYAAAYRSLKLQTIPCHDKIPMVPWKEFQDTLMSQGVFDGLFGPSGRFVDRPDTGISLVMGKASGNKIMLDLDTQKPGQKAEYWYQSILEVHNCGFDLPTWEQRSGGGGRHLFFQCPDTWMRGNAATDLNVDFRGQGGYGCVAPSPHPSGGVYEWLPERAPWEIDIMVAPPWLLDEIERLVIEHGGGEKVPPGERPSFDGFQRTSFGTLADGRERYMRDLVWAAMIGFKIENPIRPGKKELDEIYLDYSRNVTVKEPLPGESHEDGLEREERGYSKFTEKWNYALKQWDGKVEEAAKLRKEREPPKASEPPPEQKTPPNLIPVRSAFPTRGPAIPVRDWIIPGLLLKRNLSMLVAPPSSGKSLLTLQVSVAVALCIQWAGWTPRKAERVLVINTEDDADEHERRLEGVTREMGVNQSDLAGKLLLPEIDNIVIATKDPRTKSIVRTPLVENLVATIQHHGIGLVVVDPFAETFELDENSNSEVKWAGVLWREVARRTGCALLLVHHTKKYAGAMAGDADASRGGGAMIGVARVICTFFNMTEDEATAMGVEVDDRVNYVRFDDGKANYSKRGLVRWFEKKTVTLENGTAFIPADDVGVLVPGSRPARSTASRCMT